MPDDTGELIGSMPLPPQSREDRGVAAPIKLSRKLIEDSKRILAESRRLHPTKG